MADKDLVAEFESFNEVLNGCASHLSEEGIFFENTEVAAVGSAVAFEVRIRDGFSVLRGEGEIVQATNDGVFLRLLSLDRPSLKLLPKLIEHYRRRGVPLLELPDSEVAEAVEAGESPVAEELDVVEESSAAEEASEPEPSKGLTLDDLEAEFNVDEETDEEVEAEAEAGAEAEVEAEVEVAGLLIDPEELIADPDPSDADPSDEDLAADDIHLGELLPDGDDGDKAEQASETVQGETSVPLEDLPVDSGLPWLPDEPEKKSRKDLWIILLLIVLGAALGAAFYFFFLRSTNIAEWRPSEPAAVQARALPAAAQIMEPTPVTVGNPEIPPQEEVEQVPQNQAARAPESVAPNPRSHDPPSASLTGVDRITWAKEAGETVITFWGDGLFVDEQVDDFRVVGGAPREVVRIRGVRRPFPQQRIELDTDHVLQIRIGLHEEADGAALHFVADLVDSEVEILRTEAAGDQLRVYFSKAG